MKKRIYISIITLLMLMLVSCKSEEIIPPTQVISKMNREAKIACSAEENSEGETLNTYTLELELDERAGILHVKQSLDYVNKSEDALMELYFRLLPNAFDDSSVTMQSVSEEYQFLEERGAILEMKLKDSLPPGESKKISMEYAVVLPEKEGRFGYLDDTYNCSNFVCYVVPYQNGEWKIDRYQGETDGKGDPFFAEAADFDVTLTISKNLVVAASGTETGCRENGDTQEISYFAKSRRDFTFAAGADFKIKEVETQGTRVKVYYMEKEEGSIDTILSTTKKSLALFSQIYCQYPYEEFSVVITNLEPAVGGMEFSGLVFLKSLYDFGWRADEPEHQVTHKALLCLIHEVAHQWFYVTVGNDQINEPWLDEGAATYSEYLYLKEYGTDMERTESLNEVYRNISDGFQGKRVLNPSLFGRNEYYTEEGKITGAISSFERDVYYKYVYKDAAALLYEINYRLGDKKFYEALGEYFRRYQFQTMDQEMFIRFWQEHSKKDLTEVFQQFMK